MVVTFEWEREADGRWIAEVPSLAGVLTYGATRVDAVARIQALALRVFADRLEHSEAAPDRWICTSRRRDPVAAGSGAPRAGRMPFASAPRHGRLITVCRRTGHVNSSDS
ncbi:MAG: type II toxin-antitoxin system HicB family antitoxin [Casimicrobiaceae bacterium]